MPNENRIHTWAHCRNCVPQKPRQLSMREWGDAEVGLTADGLQIWCKRCNLEIAHFTPAQLQQWVGKPPPCHCCPGGRHRSAAELD